MAEPSPFSMIECGPEGLLSLPGGPSAECLDWAFGPDQKGAVGMLSVDADGRPLAAIAALKVPVLYEGKPAWIGQVMDARVDTERCGGLRNPGRFAHLAEAFARLHGGQIDAGMPLFYGVPTKSLWRLAKERLSTKLMRTQDVLLRDLDGIELPPAAGLEAESVSAFPESVTALKIRTGEAKALVTRPSCGALNHRYVEFPGGAFQISIVKRAGEVAGYAVFRTGTLEGGEPRLGLIWDWLVPDADQAVSAALMHWAKDQAASHGCAELAYVCPETCAEWLLLQSVGMRVQASGMTIAARHFARQMTMRWLYHNWNYSLGDLILEA